MKWMGERERGERMPSSPVVAECRQLLLRSLNAHITCFICKGYFVDATTVIDCLHTFCKSCLLRHFEEKDNTCPKCHNLIHQSHPSHYVSFDRTMQDLVYKLVPNLHIEEQNRREQFNKEHNIKEEDSEEENGVTSETRGGVLDDADCHRNDEQIEVCLSPEEGMRLLKRRYLACSAQTTILHLKKYLAKKLFCNSARFAELDILCNSELMGKDHMLKFIQMTRWRTNRDDPIELTYRRHIDF